MKAWKFLARGAVGPLSGFPWPPPVAGAPGAWVEAQGPLALCARGAHLCRRTDLAHWIHEELWQAEADGDHLDALDCVVVRRARLVRRIAGWEEGGAQRFAEASAAHAAMLAGGQGAVVRAFLDDAEAAARAGYLAVSAHCAAVAAARLAPHDPVAAYRRERLWQAEWIAREVIGA
jgi:hypothetical protein